MFTLSGIFLEDGEKLFRDFWSPFSISFLSFSARRIVFLRKSVTDSGPYSARTPRAGLFKPRPRGPDSPAAPRPSQTLARIAPRPRRRSPSPPRRNPAGLEVAAAGFSFKTVRFFINRSSFFRSVHQFSRFSLFSGRSSVCSF